MGGTTDRRQGRIMKTEVRTHVEIKKQKKSRNVGRELQNPGGDRHIVTLPQRMEKRPKSKVKVRVKLGTKNSVQETSGSLGW